MDKQKIKYDITLLLMLLLTAFAMRAVWGILGRGDAHVVTVSQNGREIARYSLLEDITVTIPCKEDGEEVGYNLLMVSGGKAFLSDADCPDRLCVSQRPISKKGDSIICLPHKLVITIDSDKESELDAITY